MLKFSTIKRWFFPSRGLVAVLLLACLLSVSCVRADNRYRGSYVLEQAFDRNGNEVSFPRRQNIELDVSRRSTTRFRFALSVINTMTYDLRFSQRNAHRDGHYVSSTNYLGTTFLGTTPEAEKLEDFFGSVLSGAKEVYKPLDGGMFVRGKGQSLLIFREM